ncbi:MAG: carbohydrate kinase family protein [Patescibacteria group bacterium]|jgi:hypothetical protein
MLHILRKFDACTIGAGSRDVFIKSSHFEKERDSDAPDGFDACFPMGAKITLDDAIFETGGGATNAAVTFSRFGLSTACICAVGQDQNGKSIIEVLKKEKVDFSGIQEIENKQTNFSVIILAGTGQRSILVHRGAASDLHTDQIVWRRMRSRWTYLTSLGGDMKKNRDIIAQCTKRKSSIAWNPGNGELQKGLATLKPLIEQVDILIVNREEAAMLAKQDSKNLKTIIKELKGLPKTALLITDGPRGAYVYDNASKKLWTSPALPGKRINTTGAGDAFGSAFVAAYIKTENCVDGLRAGLLNSLGVITHMGAKAGILKKYPSKQQLRRIKVRDAKL